MTKSGSPPPATDTSAPIVDPNSIGFLIADIARLKRVAFEREIEKAAIGVTTAEARVLAHMARCGAVRQNVLAQRLNMQPMSLTGFLDRMETANLIKRAPDPVDRRAKIASLTNHALSLFAQIANAGCRADDIACAGMTEAERETYRDLSMRIRDNLESARATHPEQDTTS